ARHVVQPADERQVLAAGQLAVHAHALTGVADDLADLRAAGLDVVARDADAAARLGEERCDDLDRRALARAVGPEEAEHLALVDREAHAIHGADLGLRRAALPAAIDLDEILDLDDRCAYPLRPPVRGRGARREGSRSRRRRARRARDALQRAHGAGIAADPI